MTLQPTEEVAGENWLRKMAQQLSGVTVVIIVAGGVLTFLLLFIFAKRQIMRFTIRSHRGSHTPLGYEANKSLRREILRRIDAIPKVTFEPQMLRDDVDLKYSEDSSIKPCHYYRMKVVDEAKSLELSIVKKKLGKRHSFESLRSYFIVILTPQVDPRVVHQFCDLYEAARFNPKAFGEEEYRAFSLLVKQLRNVVVTLQPKSSIRSPVKGTILSKTFTKEPVIEEKKNTLSAPYIRRVSKKEKSKWNADEEEETALCHSSNTLHEISIISSNKDESTVV